MFTDEACVTQDLKIKITNAKSQKFAFYYWLNATYIMQDVGKVKKTPIDSVDSMNFLDFLIHDHNKRPFSSLSYEEYQIEYTSKKNLPDTIVSDASTDIDFKASKKMKSLTNRDKIEMFTKHMAGSIARFEQRYLRKISGKNRKSNLVIEEVKESEQSMSDAEDEDNRCDLNDENEEISLNKPAGNASAIGGGSFRIT